MENIPGRVEYREITTLINQEYNSASTGDGQRTRAALELSLANDKSPSGLREFGAPSDPS